MNHDPTQDASLRDDPQMARLLDGLRADPGPDAATRAALWQRIAADLPTAGASGGGTTQPPATAMRAGAKATTAALTASSSAPRTWSGPWLALGGTTIVATLAAIVWLLQPPPEPVIPASSASRTPPASAPSFVPPTEVALPTAERAVAVAGAEVAAPPAPEAMPEPPTSAPAAAETMAAAEEPEAAAQRPRPPLRPEDALKVEVALLGRARAALDRGSPDAALAALRHHGRKFADGQLAEEREALEIVALARLGKAGVAQAKAQQFLHQHSRSLHSQAVRDAIADMGP